MLLAIETLKHKQLNHIKLAKQRNKGSVNFPDFLIVGPQRTGTTWIYENLRANPGTFFSFPKELYFFNRLTEEYSGHSLHFDNLKKTTQPFQFRDYFKEITKIAYFDFIRTGSYRANELQWYTSFFKQDWLRSVTEKAISTPSKKSISPLFGEATASYASLPISILEDIVSINPDIKVVVMIRNPIDRAWSHAKKDLVRDARTQGDKVSDDHFIEFFNSKYQRSCAKYSEIVSNWESVLKPGALYVGDYKRISEDPISIAMEITRHIGARDKKEFLSPNISKIVNPAGGESIPEHLRMYLEELFSDELNWITDYFS